MSYPLPFGPRARQRPLAVVRTNLRRVLICGSMCTPAYPSSYLVLQGDGEHNGGSLVRHPIVEALDRVDDAPLDLVEVNQAHSPPIGPRAICVFVQVI